MDRMNPAGPKLKPDPILQRFRSAVDAIFGNRVDRVVLFGSRARGDSRGDSDYDVAIFLREFTNRRQDVKRLVPVVTDILEEEGLVIHPVPFPVSAWQERTPLMHEIRLDGIDL